VIAVPIKSTLKFDLRVHTHSHSLTPPTDVSKSVIYCDGRWRQRSMKLLLVPPRPAAHMGHTHTSSERQTPRRSPTLPSARACPAPTPLCCRVACTCMALMTGMPGLAWPCLGALRACAALVAKVGKAWQKRWGPGGIFPKESAICVQPRSNSDSCAASTVPVVSAPTRFLAARARSTDSQGGGGDHTRAFLLTPNAGSVQDQCTHPPGSPGPAAGVTPGNLSTPCC
jgi:hypothetical protein